MGNYNKDDLLKIVRKIAKENGFTNNIKIIFERATEKLDGFMGEILAIDVIDQESQKTLQLVAKISLKNERQRNHTTIYESYKNELLAYNKFFPAIEDLRKQFNMTKQMQALVKFYQSSEADAKEILIMENLRKRGFQMTPVRKLLDGEHVRLVFKQFAELHANSFALKLLNPRKFEEIAGENVNVFLAMLDMKIGKNFVDNMTSVRDALKNKGFQHVLLDYYAKDPKGILRRLLNYGEEKYVCFSHGDSWSNNLMFKYEIKNGYKTPTDVKILDWQAWSIGPPVNDLLFCLYSSASKDVLDNSEVYLKSYHENLSNALSSFNLDVENIYPYRELKRQIAKYYNFAGIFGVMIRKIRSFDENHKVDPVNYSSDDGSTHFDAVLTVEYDEDYLLENVKDLLDYIDDMTNGKYDI